MAITGINHVTLSVSDLDQSFKFYRDVLGLRPIAKRTKRSAYFLAGKDWIALVQAKGHVAESPLYSHLALTVDAAHFEGAAERLRSSGVKLWQENSTPGDSLYFLDPSGNKLEIHAGSWESRLQWLRDHPSSDVEIYD